MFDQRNMSDKTSACSALIRNISEKDRAKDVEQFDDILRGDQRIVGVALQAVWKATGKG